MNLINTKFTGLGKTVQVVTFLDHLYEVEQIRGPFLIAVPLSTIEHWKREFEGKVACIKYNFELLSLHVV